MEIRVGVGGPFILAMCWAHQPYFHISLRLRFNPAFVVQGGIFRP